MNQSEMKWIPISEVNGYYEINRDGVVRSVPRKVMSPGGEMRNTKQREMKTYETKSGKRYVKVIINGKYARLVIGELLKKYFPTQ